MKVATGRPVMKSPGKPSLRRDTERAFWREIATGCTSERAAILAGVSQAAGTRWFRDRGGMPTFLLAPLKGRYLSFEEREEIALLNAQGTGVRKIAQELKRSPSTISRELRRNAATRAGKLDYRASVAQWKAERFAQRAKTVKLVTNERLHQYVQDKLAGVVRAPDGRIVAGPGAPEWKGRNKPHRGDREWVTAWSPEQISNRLKADFPDDESMRISHEAIYQALYVQGRGALKRELVLHLRTGRALRVPRARSTRQSWAHVTEETLISKRPPEVADRAVPGHWEGDLVIGLQRSAIGTLVERTTRFTMLIHLPLGEGCGVIPRTKNGPALAGYGAVTMADALAKTITTLPQQLRQSVTWDRGKELSDHARFTVDTGVRADSRGRCNTRGQLAISKSRSCSAGVSQPRVLRGRALSCWATR
ncbi:IS30 family transposase, partial [Crystallibacter degradans]|uniref:IS30 family transposase n=1 Tax=Crystallibacter degradans TaxID=2726743 RepID=UPI003F84E6A2